MKIEADLRIAIRAAVNERNNTINRNHWWERQAASVKALAENPRHKAKLMKARRVLDNANAASRKAHAVFEALGIDSGLRQVTNEEAFKKAGGVILEKEKPLRLDHVMTSLAAADKKGAAKIIKDLGIRWE